MSVVYNHRSTLLMNMEKHNEVRYRVEKRTPFARGDKTDGVFESFCFCCIGGLIDNNWHLSPAMMLALCIPLHWFFSARKHLFGWFGIRLDLFFADATPTFSLYLE